MSLLTTGGKETRRYRCSTGGVIEGLEDGAALSASVASLPVRSRSQHSSISCDHCGEHRGQLVTVPKPDQILPSKLLD